MKPISIIKNIFDSERLNFIFYAVLLFVLGCAFYIYFEKNCEFYSQYFIAILSFLILIWILDFKSSRAIFYLALIIFILGIFYSKFYIKHFAKNEVFEQKLYIKGLTEEKWTNADKLEDLLIEADIKGNKIFNSFVKPDATIYGDNPNLYRTYSLTGIKQIEEVKFKKDVLKSYYR